MDERIRQALDTNDTIDITTTGRKSGLPRRIEIWFRRVNGRTYITGTPGTRSWYANLLANPSFTFHLKQTIQADLPAIARFVLKLDERRAILADPAMAWYQAQVRSLEDLVAGSPLIEVLFVDERRNHELAMEHLPPEKTVRATLDGLPEMHELRFYDASHPSPSDPGAYVQIRRRGEGYELFKGNHGWSSGWKPETAASILTYMLKCKQNSK
ncbi:nitroreductase/quinone reductase family protein [Candidatus Leptofilum sp.]|uniref:nitroreductase/quinone reductase family protein n=1 Tax=Candidatus Leptofilum sp. TaxID=3241576 RepID=UPI003B5BA584